MSRAELETVRRRFERDAKSFDAIYRLERSPFWRWFNTVFRKAVFERYRITFDQAGDLTGKSVLDVGCGSGPYSVDFARRGARRVVGVDFSSNMLALAREEARRHEVEEVCEFLEANFLDVGFTEKFDVSIAMGVLDYLPDPQTFLKKMASVSTSKVIASFPGHSLFRKPLRKLRYRLAGKGSVYYYREDDLKRLADAAGFVKATIIPIRSSGTGFVLVGGCQSD
jgi:ubiquinone/menaquinone biosynthesis C-methylase UbiE